MGRAVVARGSAAAPRTTTGAAGVVEPVEVPTTRVVLGLLSGHGRARLEGFGFEGIGPVGLARRGSARSGARSGAFADEPAGELGVRIGCRGPSGPLVGVVPFGGVEHAGGVVGGLTREGARGLGGSGEVPSRLGPGGDVRGTASGEDPGGLVVGRHGTVVIPCLVTTTVTRRSHRLTSAQLIPGTLFPLGCPPSVTGSWPSPTVAG